MEYVEIKDNFLVFNTKGLFNLMTNGFLHDMCLTFRLKGGILSYLIFVCLRMRALIFFQPSGKIWSYLYKREKPKMENVSDAMKKAFFISLKGITKTPRI